MSWSKNNRLHVAVGLLWVVLSSTGFAQSDKPSAQAEEEVATFKAPPRSIKDVIRAVENGKVDETEVARAKEIIAMPVPQTTDSAELRKYYMLDRLWNDCPTIELEAVKEAAVNGR